jgi:hypothetical protein
MQNAAEHVQVENLTHTVTMPSEEAESFMEPPIRFRRKDNNKRCSKKTHIITPQTLEEERERLQFAMEEIDSLVKGWETPKRNI